VKAATFRHRVEYALVVIVRGVVRILPDAFSRALGTFIGLSFYAIDGAHRRLAFNQLHAAFPTREPAECRAIARATFAHFGRLLVALLRFSTLTIDQIRERVEFEGDDRIRAALAMC
jgi:lauroyl/myristoyl acyltransferase